MKLRLLLIATLAFSALTSAVADDSPSQTLGLAEPVKVDLSHMLTDGGSLGGTLTDSQGKTLAFVYDGRQTFFAWLPWHKYHIYVGAHDPEEPSAKALGICSKEERAIYFIVQSWVTKEYPANWRKGTSGGYIARFIDDLGARSC